ncbi:L,D-transpeptidase [Bradyrhizobium sp. RDM12]
MLLPAVLAGCVSDADFMPKAAAASYAPTSDPRYGAVSDGAYTVAAVPAGDLKTRYMRQLVDDPTGQPAGTVGPEEPIPLSDAGGRQGAALRRRRRQGRYGLVGYRRCSDETRMAALDAHKDMIAREPDKYVKWARGMEGGAQNPLGARALYLFKDGKDTLYRIHGTNEPWSIGQAMSSGCIRMMNQDVIDLYRRVLSGAKVMVLPAGGETAASGG